MRKNSRLSDRRSGIDFIRINANLIINLNKDGKNLADIILQRLFKNAEINGIRFGPVLQILFASEHSQKFPIKGQVGLNLSSRWKIFDSRPLQFPESEEDLQEMTNEEQILSICSIRERTVEKVELGEDSPHLILTLDDKKVFFINGKDENYESWDVGVAFGDIEQSWQVIACPNGELAIWTPPKFSFDKDFDSLKADLE
jgi:hypothetical protein